MADQPTSETPAFHNPETRRLRLKPLPLSALPSHPTLNPAPPATTEPTKTTAATPGVTPLAIEILNEAVLFTDTLMHTQFRAKGKPQTSSPASASVQLLSLDLMGPGSAPEYWFGRRSEHEDRVANGTASWAEFEGGLFDEHSVNEGRYTPDVFDAKFVAEYGAAEGLDAAALRDAGWEDVHVEVYEMGHEIPGPLSDRVFCVLVVRGKVRADKLPVRDVKSGSGFVTAQVPVDISTSPASFYASGRNRKEGQTAQQKAKVVIGEYVSVERGRVQDDGKIVWEMATASDAKGSLPMFLQKLGVPGAVIKDVGLFIKWRQEERKKGSA